MSLSHPLPRELTRPVHVGGVQIGGGAPVVVQSMTCTDTADAQATLAQVCALAQAGCDIVRVSVPTEAALEGFRTICAESPVPIVADIHFNHKLAIGAVELVPLSCASTPAISAIGPRLTLSSMPRVPRAARFALA